VSMVVVVGMKILWLSRSCISKCWWWGKILELFGGWRRW